MTYKHITENTCSKEITFDLDGDKVRNISFLGGCNGNLKAISILLEGKSVDEIEGLLKGTICGRRPTSCVDQLCIGIRNALNQSN